MHGKKTGAFRLFRNMAVFFLAVGLTTALPASPPGTAGEGSHRFQFEFFGGPAQPGLSAFNGLVDYDNQIQDFSYDHLFDSLRDQGGIVSWSKNQPSGRKKIVLTLPFGMRFRYRLSPRLSVSLGARASIGRREADFSFEYTRQEPLNYEDRENVRYFPYLLSARALAVLAGLHYQMPISRKLTLETFIAAGPVFADCRYSYEWEYVWHRQGPDMDFDASQMAGHLEETGKGTGIAADLGARLQYPVLKRLAIFLEGAYSYQAVKKIAGRGREIRGDIETTWEGRWAIKKETIAAPWGTMEAEFPTNYWPEGSTSSRVRDFKLDFSGFQARIGVCLTF